MTVAAALFTLRSKKRAGRGRCLKTFILVLAFKKEQLLLVCIISK